MSVTTRKIKRFLNLNDILKLESHFLLGPRATGKSFLIREQLKDKALIVDLLNSSYYSELVEDPSKLEAMINASKYPIIVIDEVQKIPQLLDEVHRLIEDGGVRFLLTGSSARKLKRGGANLLAGRAWMSYFFPLTWFELKKFDLNKYLLIGGLPKVYFSAQPHRQLKEYINTYLYEEIQHEAVVRKIQNFSRFLNVAALNNGELLNFENIASDCGVSATTVRDYYIILQDTLVGFLLEPWQESKKRKAIKTSKFYFFDVGVANAIRKIESLSEKTDAWGKAFEHFLIQEIRAYLSYKNKDLNLGFWRSTAQHEVDLTIGNRIAIEFKSKNKISERELKNLKALKEENVFNSFYLVSTDKIPKKMDGIECLDWKLFLEKLWSDKIV